METLELTTVQTLELDRLKCQKVLNYVFDYLRIVTGKDFPKSNDNGGTWDYHGITGHALFKRGVRNQEDVDEFMGWMIKNKLQPTSRWVLACNASRGHLGANFVKYLPRFISDFKSKVMRRDLGALQGDTTDFFNTYLGSTLGKKEDTPVEVKEDITVVLSKFRLFLVERARLYHSDGDSLVSIFDLLLDGLRPSVIQERLALDKDAYRSRYSKFSKVGCDFKRKFPQYLDGLGLLLS